MNIRCGRFLPGVRAGFAVVLVFAVSAALPPRSAAELPPSAYEKKQNEAGEFLTIEVLRVEISPGSAANEQAIHAVAMVNKVGRSASGLHEGDIINIEYAITERSPGFVGPGPIPLLEERQTTVAYLTKNEETGAFTPAAGAMSFSNF